MRNGSTIETVGAWVALTLAGALAAHAVPDPCLLTVTEARELGGTDTVQAGGRAETCTYMTSNASPRLTISVFAAEAPSSQEILAQLEDGERYTARKNGRARTWVAADKLEGWVQSGDVLASVSASGEANGKRRRKLELTVYRISEKLR
jgi:hypothetical protein